MAAAAPFEPPLPPFSPTGAPFSSLGLCVDLGAKFDTSCDPVSMIKSPPIVVGPPLYVAPPPCL